MNKNPLEKVIEQKVCDYARSKGCLVYKFTSPSRRSVPDRLFITPLVTMRFPLKMDGCFFIEFKRLGEKPTAAQQVEIDKIRRQGVNVFVIDNAEAGKVAVDSMFAGARGEVLNDPAF